MKNLKSIYNFISKIVLNNDLIYLWSDFFSINDWNLLSLTSHIVKVFERVLKKKLVDFLEVNDLIVGSPHGFRAGRITLSQLLALVDSILCSRLEGLDSDCIYLDFVKHFNKVNHALLIDKMNRLAIHPTLIWWIESFLSNRKQCVVVDGVK